MTGSSVPLYYCTAGILSSVFFFRTRAAVFAAQQGKTPLDRGASNDVEYRHRGIPPRNGGWLLTSIPAGVRQRKEVTTLPDFEKSEKGGGADGKRTQGEIPARCKVSRGPCGDVDALHPESVLTARMVPERSAIILAWL